MKTITLRYDDKWFKYLKNHKESAMKKYKYKITWEQYFLNVVSQSHY